MTRELPRVMASVMAVLLSSSRSSRQYRLRYFSLPPTQLAQARALTAKFSIRSPRELCCPLLCGRHLPLIGCTRGFIGIGVPSSLGLGPDRIGASVVFFLKLQRLSKTYAIDGECSRTLFFCLVRPARRSPAARPVVARIVTDFVNLFRTARIDPLHVGIAPYSGCSPPPLPGDTRQRSRRIIPCGALRVVHRAAAPPVRDSFSLLEVGAERRGAARNRARIAPPNFCSGGRPRRRRTDQGFTKRVKSPITRCIDSNVDPPDDITPCIALTRFCA